MYPSHITTLITALSAHQERLGLSHKKFAPHCQIDSTTWSRLLGGTYALGENSKIEERLEEALRILDENRESSTRKIKTAGLIKTLSHIKPAIDAVKAARVEERDRLAVILGPTGAGKTKLAQILQAEYSSSIYVEATPSWKDSYPSALRGIAEAAGASLAGPARDVEASLRQAINSVAGRIIIIDEADNFGRDSAKLLRWLLNQTTCVVVILSVPKLWDSICEKWPEELAQLKTRAIVVRRFGLARGQKSALSLGSHDMHTYLTAKLRGYPESPDKKEICETLRAEAEKFGLYNTADKIISFLHDEDAPLTAEAAQTAVKLVQASR